MDGHLDLAANVIAEGRDYTLSAAEIRAIQRRTDQQATVSLPDLVRGGVGVVFATLFAAPDGAGYSDDGYTTPQGAERRPWTSSPCTSGGRARDASGSSAPVAIWSVTWRRGSRIGSSRRRS